MISDVSNNLLIMSSVDLKLQTLQQFSRAAITKAYRLDGLNTRISLSRCTVGEKSEIKVSAGVHCENCEEEQLLVVCGQSLACGLVTSVFSFMFIQCFPCVCVCVQVSWFYQYIVILDQGSTLLQFDFISTNYVFKDPIS